MDGQYVVVNTSHIKPKWCDDFFDIQGEVVHICPAEFKTLFGFCPEPGECLKVAFKAKVVK